MTELVKLLSKMISGRWILTVVCAVVFAYCAIHKMLEAACVSAILTSVFTSYFGRSDRNGNGDNNGKSSN